MASGALGLSCRKGRTEIEVEPVAEGAIRCHRVLGRTGYQVSDISMGCASLSDANVVRQAYDRGVNYFDTAEVYGNGDSETKIGEVMQFMDRKKIFITTKLVLGEEDTADSLVERFTACLARMKTDYADALFMHGIENVALVDNVAFHAAVERLQADGRLRFRGISSHGPRRPTDDSMEDVLCKAAADGRFDLMLLSYNFMNVEEGRRVLAACRENKVGTTAMKTCPGYLEVDRWDPENPAEGYARYIERATGQGVSREQAIQNIVNWIAGMDSVSIEMKPFRDKYGVSTQEQLRETSVQWVLANQDMHTICVSMPDFDGLDRFLPLSGTQLSAASGVFLEDFRLAYGHRYCRQNCGTCVASCPEHLPVNTIMRYSYYFATQGREKFAMKKYAALGEKNASLCLTCSAPCSGRCPHGVNIQGNLARAHSLLSLA